MRLRFHTARDVFTAFPTLQSDMVAKPADVPPLDYFRQLQETETPEDAITFFAYMAPKREAVWWGCRCIRSLRLDVHAVAALQAAEMWLADPEEERRRAALIAAEDGPSGAPETWAAYGAGWAGGNIALDGQPPIPAAPHLTAKAVRATVLIAVAIGPAAARRERLQAAYGEAMGVVSDDIARHFR